MTSQEIKDFVFKKRMEAYIYYGVEAEMDLVSAKFDRLAASSDDDRMWEDRRIKRNLLQIERANERLDDIQVRYGVIDE